MGEGAERLLDVVFGGHRPNQMVAYREVSAGSAIPLLEGRAAREGKATAYVCENFACQMPVTGAEVLQAQSDSIL